MSRRAERADANDGGQNDSGEVRELHGRRPVCLLGCVAQFVIGTMRGVEAGFRGAHHTGGDGPG